MTLLCQKIWVKKEWPYEFTQYLIIPIPKKGDPRKFNNYKTNSLISHPNNIMLRIILNRLNPIGEYILAEDKAGFRKKRSTIGHIGLLNHSNLYVSSLNHYMEESKEKHITTDKNAIVFTTH